MADTSNPGIVLAAIDDLMFTSKLDSFARSLGLQMRRSDPHLAATSAIAFVSLNVPEGRWRSAIADLKAADPNLPVIGFGPHADGALMKAAQTAGCVKVVANSAFATEGAALIRRFARFDRVDSSETA